MKIGIGGIGNAPETWLGGGKLYFQKTL